jgi:hypothetical protein
VPEGFSPDASNDGNLKSNPYSGTKNFFERFEGRLSSGPDTLRRWNREVRKGGLAGEGSYLSLLR